MQFGKNSRLKGTLEALGSRGGKVSKRSAASYALKQTARRPFQLFYDHQDLVKQNSALAAQEGIGVRPSVANTVDQPIARNPSRSILVSVKNG